MYSNRNSKDTNYETVYDKYQGADGITFVNISITNPMTNNNPVIDSTSIDAEITEIRGESIIDNPEDYFLAISRFSIPLYSTCLINCANYIRAGQNDINLTNFSFTLGYNGFTSAQTFLEYIPTYINKKEIPTSPVPNTGALQLDYYKLYNYITFIRMCNIALKAAFDNLASQTTLPLNGNSPAAAPYFIYDAPTQLISLICQKVNYINTAANPIFIYFNSILAPFLYSIAYTDNQDSPRTDTINYFNVTDNYNNTLQNDPVVNIGVCLQFQQEYISLDYWNSFKSLIITSNTLPIKPEATPPGPRSSLILQNQLNSSNINSRLILSDFQPDLLKLAGQFSSIASYQPGFSDYRLINMYSSQPIRKINIILSWVDTYGNIFPIYLNQGNTASIKLAFIPKKFYLNFHNKPKF